jgi:hypothetical protein
MFTFTLLVLAVCTFVWTSAQTIIAGNAINGYVDNITATAAELAYPMGVWGDPTGNIYFADYANYRFRKVNLHGKVVTIGGTGKSGTSGQGGAFTSVSVYLPTSITADTYGYNLYFCDQKYIWKYTVSTGTAAVFAGTFVSGFSGDNGPATSAQFNDPMQIYYSAYNNYMYVADMGNNRIRRINMVYPNIVTTFAGTGTPGYSGDGGTPATSCAFQHPTGVFGDTLGNIYIADSLNYRVRMVSPNGYVNTIAGTGVNGFNGDGLQAVHTQLAYPYALAGNNDGNLYVYEKSSYRIRQISNVPFYYISTVSTYGIGVEGFPWVDTASNIYYPAGNYINQYPASVAAGIGKTLPVGSGIVGFKDNVPAYEGNFNTPIQIWPDSNNNLYITDAANYRVRFVSARTGNLTTIGGTGKQGNSGLIGSAAFNTVKLWSPYGIWGDAMGEAIYVTDQWYIWKYTPADGQVMVYCGKSTQGYSGDGQLAMYAYIKEPTGIFVTPVTIGEIVYFADTGNNVIRSITTSYIISTIAGTGGTGGYNGQGFLAIYAKLDTPMGVWVDQNQNLIYIADTDNNRIRMIDPWGVLWNFAGDGNKTFNGDNLAATKAALNNPVSIIGDNEGNIFISDYFNDRIRKVSDGIISTILPQQTNQLQFDRSGNLMFTTFAVVQTLSVSSSSSDNGLSNAAIIAIAVGSVLAVVAISGVGVFCYYYYIVKPRLEAKNSPTMASATAPSYYEEAQVNYVAPTQPLLHVVENDSKA